MNLLQGPDLEVKAIRRLSSIKMNYISILKLKGWHILVYFRNFGRHASMGQGSVVNSIEKSAESSMQNVFLPKIVKSISLVDLEK